MPDFQQAPFHSALLRAITVVIAQVNDCRPTFIRSRSYSLDAAVSRPFTPDCRSISLPLLYHSFTKENSFSSSFTGYFPVIHAVHIP